MGRLLHVLVADDDFDTANGLGLLVRLWGHHAEVAYGGEQAWRLGRLHRFDAAFLDLDLPRLDGLQLARRLSMEAGPGGMHLVDLTGPAVARYREQCLAAGFPFYRVTPVEPAEVERLLDAFAEAKAVARSVHQPTPTSPADSSHAPFWHTARSVQAGPRLRLTAARRDGG